jgi:tetratricopeptide (TPR) repeat protein
MARQAKFADAVRTLGDAVTRNPENAAAFNDLGSVLLRLASTQTGTEAQATVHQAETALREAVRIQPEFASLRMNLADALIRTGKLSDAQQQLEEAVRIGGRAETAESAWFTALLATGSADQALKAWRDSFAVQTAAAHINLGTLFASENKPDDAIREYRLAVAGDPQSDLAQFNLGLTLYGRGLKDEALPYLQKAARSSNPGIRSAAASFLQKQ